MSQISPLIFFSSENELFSWIYLLKKKSRRTKILISPGWNKILKIWGHTFWAHTNRSTMQQKLFQHFFTTRSWSFWKTHAQNWKICMIYIPRVYLLCLQSNASGSFLQKCINFLEQQLKFSHFEGSIIP